MSIFGIFNLHKPKDLTSRKVVDHVQRLVKLAKAGHAGTLDPLATGVVVVCVGPATRLISRVQELPKVYRGQFRFGMRSDTDDITGMVEAVADAPEVSRAELADSLPDFIGVIEQIPPQFSAVHINGKRAYALARAGKTVEIQPKQVQIDRIEVLSFDWPDLELEIECGSGTYIRSLGRDLGNRFGCGAVMTDLVRTRIGPFDIRDAVALDELNADSLEDHVIPATRAVEHWPKYRATEAECRGIKNGRRIPLDRAQDWISQTRIAVLTPEGDLAALAEVDLESNQIVPRQVFLR